MIRGALLGCALLLASGPAEAQPTRPREAAKARTYRVVAGATKFSVAWHLGIPWPEIAVANGLDPEAPLRPNQVLTIPRKQPERSASTSPRPGFSWPVEGEVKRAFGATGHDGLDLAAPRGTSVRAAAPGTVIFAGAEPRQFGNLVVIDHGGGWHSAYGFLDRVTVREGQRVRDGARVGWSGSTGLAKGEELHFEIRRDNRPVDPLPLLGER